VGLTAAGLDGIEAFPDHRDNGAAVHVYCKCEQKLGVKGGLGGLQLTRPGKNGFSFRSSSVGGQSSGL
jgi:hypothetical protein